MKLTKLAIAVAMATSVALVGCGGKKSSSKGDESKVVKNEVKQLSVNIGGVEIQGISQEFVSYKGDGKIIITPDAADAAKLKQAGRLIGAYHIFVFDKAVAVDGVVEDPKARGEVRVATKNDLTSVVKVVGDKVTVELTVHNRAIDRISLVRVDQPVSHEVQELHRVEFNIRPATDTTKTVVAKAGLTALDADGQPTAFSAELSKITAVQLAASSVNPVSLESLKLDDQGKVKLVNITEVTATYVADDVTAVSNAVDTLNLEALANDGITVKAVVKPAGNAAVKLQEVVKTKEVTTVTQAIDAIQTADPAGNEAEVYALQFTFDSGLGQRPEELVLVIKATVANGRDAITAEQISDAVNTVINPAPKPAAQPAKDDKKEEGK